MQRIWSDKFAFAVRTGTAHRTFQEHSFHLNASMLYWHNACLEAMAWHGGVHEQQQATVALAREQLPLKSDRCIVRICSRTMPFNKGSEQLVEK